MQKALEWVSQHKYRAVLFVDSKMPSMPSWILFGKAFRRFVTRRKASFIAAKYLTEVEYALDKLAEGDPWELADYLKRLYAKLEQEGLAVPGYRYDGPLNTELWLNLHRSYLSFVRTVATSSLAVMSVEEFRRGVEIREKEHVAKPVMKGIAADLKEWKRRGK